MFFSRPYVDLTNHPKLYVLKDASVNFCPPGAQAYTKPAVTQTYAGTTLELSPETQYYISPINGKEYPVNPLDGQPEQGYYTPPGETTSHYYYFNPNIGKYMIAVTPLMPNFNKSQPSFISLDQYNAITGGQSATSTLSDVWNNFISAPAHPGDHHATPSELLGALVGVVKQPIDIGIAADELLR